MPDPAEIDDRIDRASARPFGRRFHLRGRERAAAQLRGPRTMRAHAAEIIAERLAPAEPRNDGRQTPYRNHPVFVAQHATATCCRSCLETWHGIAKGHRLNRGGNRQANHALWRIVITRMSSDPRTRTYVQRRLDEGLTKPEIIRMLKRYVARETWRHLPR